MIIMNINKIPIYHIHAFGASGGMSKENKYKEKLP